MNKQSWIFRYHYYPLDTTSLNKLWWSLAVTITVSWSLIAPSLQRSPLLNHQLSAWSSASANPFAKGVFVIFHRVMALLIKFLLGRTTGMGHRHCHAMKTSAHMAHICMSIANDCNLCHCMPQLAVFDGEGWLDRNLQLRHVLILQVQQQMQCLWNSLSTVCNSSTRAFSATTSQVIFIANPVHREANLDHYWPALKATINWINWLRLINRKLINHYYRQFWW